MSAAFRGGSFRRRAHTSEGYPRKFFSGLQGCEAWQYYSSFAARGAPRTRDGIQWNRRDRCSNRGSAARMPHRNLRSGRFRPHHFTAGCSGCCHQAGGILLDRGRQRCARSAICRCRRDRVGPFAVGALWRKFASSRASLGTTFARCGLTARKRRLRTDRPRSWRSAAANGATDSTDHVVPFPPCRRTYLHRTVGNRAAVHRWKLLLLINTAGGERVLDKTAYGFSISGAHPCAIADRTGNHRGNSAIPAGSQAGSFRRDHIRQQNCLGWMISQ